MGWKGYVLLRQIKSPITHTSPQHVSADLHITTTYGYKAQGLARLNRKCNPASISRNEAAEQPYRRPGPQSGIAADSRQFGCAEP